MNASTLTKSLEFLIDELPEIAPLDEYHRALVSHVHPMNWQNPEPPPRHNLVVIGAGTAGLGARGALVEKRLIGGDCLNAGCMPSKALLRAARAYADPRDAESYGVGVPAGVTVDFPAVMGRMRQLRAKITTHGSAKRFQSMGADVFLGEARFTGPEIIEVDGRTLRCKQAVIATGARAVAPPTFLLLGE